MTDPAATTRGFVHLHVHSEYSMLDGLGRVGDIAAKAASDGQPAVAVTDHGNLSAAFSFRAAALKAGVKPILGCEIYLAIGSRFAPESVEVARDDDTAADMDTGNGARDTKTKVNEHLTVIARNGTGWRNLVALMNKAQDTYWYKPLADYDLLAEHGEGLIVLTGCLGGPIAGPVSRGDMVTAQTNLERLIAAVGKENVYVEIMEHGIAAEANNLRRLKELADANDLPLVVTNDCHYVEAEDAQAHEAWLAIQSGKQLSDPARFKFHGTGYHLATEAEMRAIKTGWAWQKACDTTVEIAERVSDDVIAEAGMGMRLPKFPVPEGFESTNAYFRHLVREGAKDKYGVPFTAELKERLRLEFDVISGKGLDDYFLIVHDLMNWSRSDRGIPTTDFPEGEPGGKRPILTGYGRGSAAGSVISYCLGIVGIDPLENHLLFERFLEPDREGMPDIDLDFESDRRDDILAYLEARYGQDRVARIGTVGKARSRRAVKDAARILGEPTLGIRLSKAIPVVMGKPYEFKRLEDTSDGSAGPYREELKKAGEPGESIVTFARAFESVVNGESIHACGVIIADESLDDLVPLRFERKAGQIVDAPRVSGWDGSNVDDFGLLKLDVLGLRNLDIVAEAIRNIHATTGEQVDMFTIPHPNTAGDPRVTRAWDLICEGRTLGVFQMDSPGMQKMASDVAPRTLTELSAVIALYRPGALSAGSHTRFIERKHGREDIDYTKYTDDPAEAEAIHSVLHDTQGVFVFQESLMRLGTVIAGFNASQRSALRKAVGKKKEDLMRKVGGEFLDGAPREFRDETGELISPVFSVETAQKVWADMQGSADYLFNASHSAAYAQLAYITAYLKANWPVEYGAAVLSIAGKGDKRITTLESLRSDGISVLPPNVNLSGTGTTPVDGEVLLGLSEIKGVGKDAHWIIVERERGGKFESLADLVNRVKVPGNDVDENGEPVLDKQIGLGLIEGLIVAGACDDFGPRLGQIIALRALRDRPDMAIPDARWGVIETSARQREVLGVALDAQNPLIVLGPQLKSWVLPTVTDLKLKVGGKPVSLRKAKEAADSKAETSVVTLGLLSRWEKGAYGGGTRVNFTIEGSNTSMDGVAWNSETVAFIERYGEPRIGDIIALSGRVRTREISVEKTEVNEEGEEETTISVTHRQELTASSLWLVNDPESDAISDPVVINVNTVGAPTEIIVDDEPEADDAPATGVSDTSGAVDDDVVDAAEVPDLMIPVPNTHEVTAHNEVDPAAIVFCVKSCDAMPAVQMAGRQRINPFLGKVEVSMLPKGAYRLAGVNEPIFLIVMGTWPETVPVEQVAALMSSSKSDWAVHDNPALLAYCQPAARAA